MEKGKIKRIFFALFLTFCVLLSAGNSAKSIEKAEKDKRYVFYQRALYEVGEAMTSMQVTLKKLEIANSASMETEYLSSVYSYALSAQTSLSSLPIGTGEVVKTMKFVNQAGDFALSALKRIAHGGALNEDARKTISVLTKECSDLALSIGTLIARYNEGAITLSDYSFDTNEGFAPLTKPGSEYPTLLYDGPFSDSLLDGEMKGLGNEIYTKEMALEVLKDFFGGDITEIYSVKETEGNEKTYVFDMMLKGRRATSAVTKRGGQILYLLSDDASSSERLTEDECISIAEEYLLNKGFGETKSGYYRKYEGIITVNLAPVENGVILYPDIVKVQVDMDTGDVMGLEFTNYYQNHVKRELQKPQINQREAEERIDSSLEIVNTRLSLIPNGIKETLSYEVHAKRDTDEFLIYIDAFTGDEIMLYEVVHMDEGTIVQ